MGELTMEIDIDTVWKILGVIFACGVVWAKLEAIQKDIARLEKKADESNRVKERLGVVEVKVEELIKEHTLCRSKN